MFHLNGVEVEDTFAEMFPIMEMSPAKPLFFRFRVVPPRASFCMVFIYISSNR
jgi:hypothetical protein